LTAADGDQKTALSFTNFSLKWDPISILNSFRNEADDHEDIHEQLHDDVSIKKTVQDG